MGGGFIRVDKKMQKNHKISYYGKNASHTVSYNFMD